MWRDILGIEKKQSSLLELTSPHRTFNDVVLPDETRQQLYEALTQIRKHGLIFQTWGLGERHPSGAGLAFNFAGPPGTGKTICAEAVAYTLGRKLLRVRYSELESCWVGETGKNIRAVFREARAQNAVLFFDEADSIASRRFSNVQAGYEREANQAVNILLKELEEHEGVVIFATNMASNFDPAFERRIRTHILFKTPGVAERERIWKAQIHPSRTPLGKDVNFRELAERFEVTGGDIRNAVLKAAQISAAAEGPDETKRILQRHFLQAMEQVLAAKRVMQQNAIVPASSGPVAHELLRAAENRLKALEGDLNTCRNELALLEETQSALAKRVDSALSVEQEQVVPATLEELVALREETAAQRRQEQTIREGELEEVRRRLAENEDARTAREADLERKLEEHAGVAITRADALGKGLQATRQSVTNLGRSLERVQEELEGVQTRFSSSLVAWQEEQTLAVTRLDRRIALHQEILNASTLLPATRGVVTAVLIILALLLFAVGLWVGYSLLRS